jgi:trk system potassium uptake protein TrkH
LISFFGALPAYLSGAIPHFIDALFESISGFTTTGSTILTDVEVLPKGILFWRSLTHWFGGMGILVFTLILLPSMNGQTQQIMRAESPGPSPSKLVPKIRDTAKILYGIYAAMTAVVFIALVLAGMPVYDAIIHAVGAAGTGGFSCKNLSVAYYDSVAIDTILSIAMLCFGVNFSIYFMILTKKWSDIKKNEELKCFLLCVTVAIAMITANIMGQAGGVGKAFRYALFQVSTIISTTGYATADFNLWPTFSKMILLGLMFIGSCAGSTAGGFKQIRLVVMSKAVRRSAKKVANPRSVISLKTEGKNMDNEAVMNIAIFCVAYFILICLAALLVSLDNFDIETSYTAVLATVSNIGPGIGFVGPMGNFSIFSDFSKLVLSFCMLAGRLEIFPLFVLFQRGTWRKN